MRNKNKLENKKQIYNEIIKRRITVLGRSQSAKKVIYQKLLGIPHSEKTVYKTFESAPTYPHLFNYNLGSKRFSFCWAQGKCRPTLAPTNALIYLASVSRISVGLKYSMMAGKVLCHLSGGYRGQPGLALLFRRW